MPSKCALRVSSKTTSVTEIQAKIGAEPSRVFRPSDPVSKANPTPRGVSLALFESGAPPDAPLDEHIARVLQISRRQTDGIDALRATCDIDVFCMYASESGQGSCELSPTLLRELANLGVPLVIDLYPPTLD